jgi:L,D-transpeptidase catalytic domain
MLLVPYKQADISRRKSNQATSLSKLNPSKDPLAAEQMREEADIIYDSIQLGKAGLKKEAFEYAWKGYNTLLEKNKVQKTGIITICDFSQSSRRKRMYLIDIENYKLLMQTHVAHGRNSGKEYATRFSNKSESHQSSLGFYLTGDTYWGGHGFALRIDGLEPGINDKAESRKIVVHGSRYVGPDYLRLSKYIGRSFGCPAIPSRQSIKVINVIKNGTCFFIYHPTKKYIETSKILNG